MLVVTAGLPASGKSTIAEVVGNRLGLPVLSVDPQQRTCIVEPGIVLDRLNAQLAQYGLRYGPSEDGARGVTGGHGVLLGDVLDT